MTTAYPLAWPAGWPRTRVPAQSRFNATVAAALKEVQDELRRINARAVVISSNASLGDFRPKDPGVAIYFVRAGRQLCVPCDAWSTIEDNLRAIAKTLDALRGIERWGAKHMVDAAFSGFVALPPPDPVAGLIAARPWHEVLGVAPDATEDQIDAAWRDLARRNHPDITHDDGAAMAAINRARDDARAAIASR